MAAGGEHALMLKSDGTVWVWGNNSHSQQFGGAVPPYLGNADSDWNPSRVPGVLGAIAVAAGSYHSLVLKWDGTVLAWGENSNGQLGVGDTTVKGTPVVVTNLSGVTAIDGGEDFSMAVLQNGTVKSWGHNPSGVLGIGTAGVSRSTTPTNVLTLTNAVGVACGYQHALALDANGNVWGWGHNGYGEVGDGFTTDRYSPVRVTNLNGVVGIAAGEYFSLAVKTNGSVWVWGRNNNGRLGLGNIGGSYFATPTNISALSNICIVRAGSQQGYAVDTSGKLWLWGNNGFKTGYGGWALGLIAPAIVYSPTQQVSFPNVLFIGTSGPKLLDTAPRHFSAAFYSDGVVRHWGALYYNSTTDLTQNTPQISSTNIDWSYTNSLNGQPTYPTAYYRGYQSIADFASFVLPLDFQAGLQLNNTGGVATNLLPFVTNNAVAYHFNLTNSSGYGQTNLALRIQYQNPIVAFGKRVGGSALYTERSYRYIAFGGCTALTNDYPFLFNYTNAFQIDVYWRTNFAYVGSTNVPIPFYLTTNGTWSAFLTNGLQTALTAYGLATTLSTRSYPNAYGVTNNGVLEVEHQASGAATNYIFVVKVKGLNGLGCVSLLQDLTPAWQPLYTLEFEPAPPWNIRFLSQIQFQNEPLPPFYDGKSLDELLTNSWTITNVMQLGNPISSYTNLDQSPELRQHPILDNFVDELKHDPLALARFVQNEIELTDAIDYLMTNQITAGQLNLGGVNRSALGTFLERQGSPTEQCALLLYLLRRAGVPAVYAFPPTNGIKMLDTRLSKMLRVQLNHALDPNSLAINTNSLISVNYPWIAAYINNQWIHLFPWIKDTEINEGPNLYDFMPAAYDNATKWVVGYLFNRPEIVGLGDPNETPEVLFPRYVKQQLQANAPGLSFDELGIQAVNRKKSYNSWDEFPAPTWVAGTNLTADTLSDSLLTNSTFRTWNPNIFPPNNIFNEAQIQVTYFNTNLFDTRILRSCDLHNRPLLIFSERTNANPLKFKMTLASYRPAATNLMAFTNDVALTNAQVLSYTFPTNNTIDLSVQVNLTRYRVSGNPEVIQRTMPIKKGDLNAICLNFGRVTKQMLEPLASTVWNVERLIKQTPSITNSLTADQHQGPLTYLMGMAYYEKVSRFIPVNAQIHGRSPITMVAIGCAKLIAQKNGGTSDGLRTGILNYYQPSVDMLFTEHFTAEAPTTRADSGEQLNFANDSFNILTIADASAKEHDVINSFFNQADAISTVKLLQLANQKHATNSAQYKDLVIVNPDNVLSLGTNSYFGFSGTSLDQGIWNQVQSAVLNSPESQAFITPGAVSNYSGSYLGTGALIIDRRGMYAALISGAGNGGWGPLFDQDYSFAPANLANVWLDVSGSDDFSVSYLAPSVSYNPFAYDSFDPAQTLNVSSWAQSGFYSYTPFNNQWAWQSAGYLGLNTIGLGLKDVYAGDVVSSEGRGLLGWLSDGLDQIMSAVHDPVHSVTGEFYVDTVDLTLVGPLPLEIRRNYSSLNTADNEFGVGWKLSFTTYMSVATNGSIMYAAEPNGSVLAYEPSGTNANVWFPTLLRNPQLVNARNEGVGSTANLFLTKIIQTNISGVTNFTLFSPNGDVRLYQVMPFAISNVVDRTRPYLTRWTDNRGNSLSFAYGTNSTETEYGQLRRVESSSGAYIQFRYDIYGHIVDALSGDGREVVYHYDDFGDLVKVILPDASEVTYDYQHSTQSVTNNGKVTQEPYSMHLVTLETKPDGRLISNTFDSQRRVTNQASTVGLDMNLVTNAIFFYSNNFVLTNFFTNTISGYTTIADVFGKITRYDYTNSRITKITDPLQQTIEQYWYDENPTQPGFYPRSLWKTKDKRGLWKEFKYDSSGNITNIVTTGSLTGAAGTQTATNIIAYNTNNLPVVSIDAIGSSNVFRYDSTFAFLPKEVVAYRQRQVISTNELFYGNATNVVTFGNATWTNIAFGLLTSGIRAYTSPDSATNEWRYDGGGFITNEIDYTSTADPALTNSLFYNGRGELFERIDGAGRVSRYDYDGLGRVISQEVFEPGQTIPLTWQYSYYNHNGDLTWSDGPQYDPEDYVWFDYDGAGRKTAEVHWRSRAKSDGSGVEAEPDDTLYSITSYVWDPFGNLTNQVDPVGNYTVLAYNAIGQMTQRVFYASGNTPLATNYFGYEPGGEVSNSTNSLGGVTQTLYTQTGKPYFRQNLDGSTNGWQYDLLGRVVKEFQPNGSYWETTYDDARLTVARQFKDSSGTLLSSTTNIFDRRGNIITNITAERGVFFSVFDGQDRIKVAGGPATVAGVSTQQVAYTYYDNSGVYLTNRNSLGGQTVSQTDAAGRPVLTEIRDSLNGNALVYSQTTSYASNHHSVTVTTGTGSGAISNTIFQDSFGSPVLSQAYPSSSVTNFAISRYDAAGRLLQKQDELGLTTVLSYDGLGRLKTKQLPDGATITNGYNSEGGLTSMAMPGGLTWSALYNSANQRLFDKLANGASVTRQFTNLYYTTGPLAGLLQTAVDLGRSVTNTFVYDAYRRVVTNSAAGTLPEHTLVTTFQFDARGLATNCVQTSGVNPSTMVSRRFDAYGQVTNEQVAVLGIITNSLTQQWNAAGRRAALLSPSAEFDYTYRVDGLMTGVTAFGSTCNFAYGNNGLLSSRSNPWRTLTVNQRDGQGRLLQQTATVGGNNALVETLTWRPDSTLSSYAGTRTGAGSWNDSRGFQYNTRSQLTSEPVGLTTGSAATNTYSFDVNKLGVLTGNQLSGGSTNNWQASSLSAFSQVTNENWNQSSLTIRAGGSAVNAATVSALLDGSGIASTLSGGRWYTDLNLFPGSHTLAATANYNVGQFSATATSGFSVVGNNSATNFYDPAGNVTNRLFANGKAQTLTWDAVGRLVSVTERTYSTNGFNWTAIYDALGRRLETVQVPVVNSATNSAMTLKIDSYYDPQVEFGEIGVAVNGRRTWKIVGPDGDRGFGSMQGVGGLEATVRESDLQTTPVLNDYSGNVLATISATNVNWSPVRLSGYGPEIGHQASPLSVGTALAETLVWRSRRIDPTGLYCLGARYYDPMAGRFLTPDPLGHEASWDLYSFCSGDPLNRFDPTGRFGKGFSEGLENYANHEWNGLLGGLAGYGLISPLTQARYSQETHEPGYYEYRSEAYEMGVQAGYSAVPIAAMIASLVLMPELGAEEFAAAEAATAAELGMGGTTALRAGAGATEVGALESAISLAESTSLKGGLENPAVMKRIRELAKSFTPEQVYDMLKNIPDNMMSKELGKWEMDMARNFASLSLEQLPGKAGFRADSPLFISKPNPSGGRVWFSITEEKPFDADALIRASEKKGPTTLITGVHGNFEGIWKPNPGVTEFTRWYINNQGLNVDVIYFGGMTERELTEVLNREGTIICRWCCSSYTLRLLRMFPR
jgi:RHS repeat-associated protein